MLQAPRPGENRGDGVGGGLLTALMLAIVAGHGAVGGLGLHGLAVRRQQHRGHQAERTVALRHRVRLHVAVVVLAGPDEAARPLQRRGDHVVDQAVFVGDARRLEFVGELGLEHGLEDVLEAPVIGLEDGVLGGQVDREFAVEAEGHRGAGEVLDRVIEVVHRHGDTGARIVEHLMLDHLTVLADELDGQLALARHHKVGGLVLVAEGVTADDDGLGPAGDEARHVLADDRLAENHAAQDVADRAVRRLPHLGQIEFLHPRLVRRDGRALHADAVLLDRVGAVDGHLVGGRVAMLNAKVVIVEGEVQIREDQLVLDQLPDDPCHLVAVEIDHGIGDFDLGHEGGLFVRETG